ncbi:MAG: segregation and condensation protein A [Elusimicrobiota bacterium]
MTEIKTENNSEIIGSENLFQELLVELDTFEGPLDLLLHVIKKKNLDIYDIPIAEITEDYLEHISLLEYLDVNKAGEFLEMASYLMRLKSKMLLPEDKESEEPGEESAAEMKRKLIERLEEYKRFKESARFFRQQEQLYDGVIGLKQYPVNEFGYEVEATLFDLIDSFKKLIESAKEEVKDIINEEISVAEKIRDILAAVESKKRLSLASLIIKCSIGEIIAILLGILELIKNSQIKVIQNRRFDQIYIEKANERQ